jgi:diaminopimelate epimerase
MGGGSVELHFVKMHGLGNDFIVVDDRAEEMDLSPEAVAWLCDRNFGIGADGLILVRPATLPEADFAWWFRNADGSAAEMCGNGIRCFAKYVIDHGLVAADQDTVDVETAVGVRHVGVTRAYDGTLKLATVDMGEPGLAARDIPTQLTCEAEDDPIIACDLVIGEDTYVVTCVSMGNPHCVLWVDDVDMAPVTTVGPLIETNVNFPDKTNVEFAQMLPDDIIRLRVWERGVGETLACGTGACAATVAASLACRSGREATVEVPGGELAIRWSEDRHVYMTGPATEVYSGTLVIDEDDA